ncbi:expansin EXLX1 family cellulose-binding protein [Nocardia sp. NBC_01499]|uniref:expansin EXLX1 family cellulose-binding protein n=1 Tax=Nocardia sp. NBC_01499 TaxID=2903597 RepID=UPI00386BDAEE
MHRIPINQRHFRSGWLWSAIGLVAIAGVAVWLTRPEPLHCDTPNALATSATSNVLVQSATSRTPVAATSIGPTTTAAPAPQPVVSGEARFYSFSQGVSCSFPGLPMDGFYVGMSTPEFGKADPCGAYLDIQGPRGDVRALIVDRCPACAPGQLDLSVAAFTQLADLSDGVAKVRYSVVRDPEPPPELSYQVKPDSTRSWFAILFSGAGNPLREVAIRPSGGGAWQNLTRGIDNYWSVSGAGSGPFDARVTDVHGNQAEVNGITMAPGLRPTGARLYSATPPFATPATTQPPVTVPTTLAAAPSSSSNLSSASCRR